MQKNPSKNTVNLKESHLPKMYQYFHNAYPGPILFYSFQVHSLPAYIIACIISILLPCIFEYVSTLSKQRLMARRAPKKRGYINPDWTLGFLKTVSSSLAYMIMLISMTFNMGLFTCLMLGFGLGSAFCRPQNASKHHVL